MLDDSVMSARRPKGLGQPVTLRVVEDLPHGFLSLAALWPGDAQAAALCVERIRPSSIFPARRSEPGHGARPRGERGVAGGDTKGCLYSSCRRAPW